MEKGDFLKYYSEKSWGNIMFNYHLESAKEGTIKMNHTEFILFLNRLQNLIGRDVETGMPTIFNMDLFLQTIISFYFNKFSISILRDKEEKILRIF